jgi:hypothetical protein
MELPNADLIRSFVLGEDESSKEKSIKATAKPRKTAAKNVDDDQEKVVKVSRKAAVKKDTVDGEEKPKKPRKPRAKKIEGGGETDGAVKATARKPRVKKSDKDIDGDDTSKEKPIRKSRAKKPSEVSQAKMIKGKVTKASTANSKPPGVLPGSKTAALESSIDDFGLAEAVRRRANWTPPVPTAKPVNTTPLPSDIFDSWLASGGSTVSSEGSREFKDLLGNFGFIKGRNSAEEKKPEEVEMTRKRKLIEPVKTNVSVAGSISLTKEKAPKKKARTITDQATSAYVNEEQEDATKTAPLLQYFVLETTDRPPNDEFKVPAKPRAKSPVKGLKTKKKATAQTPILLSPESALKQARNQDYVFGTSSQLAREDSPTLLRDLHEAMQASNEANDYDDPFADSVFNSVPTPLPDQRKMAIPTKRNLWSAAARDGDGQLIEVEMIDLANSSPPTGRASNTESKILASVPLSEPTEEGWRDIEQISRPLEQSKPVERGPNPSGLLRNELLISPPSSAQISVPLTKAYSVARDPRAISKSTTKRGFKASTKEIPEMPNFSLYSTAQLTKEFKSYGFKAIKSNNKMIETLQECWRNKHRVALEALDSNITISAQPEPPKQALKSSSQATAISPKRPRSRPTKNDKASSPQKSTSSSSKAKVVETVEGLEIDRNTPLSQIRTTKKSLRKKTAPPEDIDDSDGPSTSSPPRRQASQISKGLLPLPLSSPYGSTNLSPNSSQKALFKYISRAVKSAEPSKDPQNPSWHEKILLYDPIILEDLTIWLNTGALGKVGWDDEVVPKEVKKWCESKSICCLWRARSRY